MFVIETLCSLFLDIGQYSFVDLKMLLILLPYEENPVKRDRAEFVAFFMNSRE